MASPKEWLAQALLGLGKALGGASRSEPRVAVLIDGDSFSPRLVGSLLDYSASIGRVVTAQLYANYAAMTGAAWVAALRTHGVIGMQHFSNKSGRNGADIALVIAALDIVHSNRADHFVIVTSDSDFAALAHRLRRSGAEVHGVGPANGSKAFQQSCSVFVPLDELASRTSKPATDLPAPPARWSLNPADAEEVILTALITLGGTRNWIDLTTLTRKLGEMEPPFDPRVYRRRRLGRLLDELESVEIDRSAKQPRVRIALTTRNGSVPGPTSKS
ncbi:Uncharacterized conserved protein, LabA/DUF88 family [Devosia enhydra]|uniref:Uncharacterized conserved protein, LabA/DUF88 family n=1 Tax=Devosia enhydra TaxID=665118 RepID=A0A1K2HY93_9HYPH|nr:NYN domain-containing protein [Devosia enhydra]SFZ83473.1 Uncharacterized conserved protein, LabA/DUF88 family [Devosia enhydra]